MVSSAAELGKFHIPSTIKNMPSKWVWKRFDDICLTIVDCPHSTPKITDVGPFMVRTQDILSGNFRTEAAAHVSEETYRERTRRAMPSFGDLLYSREGTYFGIAAEVPWNVKVCLGQRMVLIRPNPKHIHFRFLRYWLNSSLLAGHVSSQRDGTVAERLNLPTIRGLPILVPPLAEQFAIANILGPLEEKIELNRQMNRILEAIIRAIFKSWFVDFDPVQAKMEGRKPIGMDAETTALFPDSFVDSPLGKIPKGWQADIIGKMCKVAIGGDWGQDDSFEGAIKSVCLRGVDLEHLRYNGRVNAPCRYIKRSSLQNRQMSNCDILVAASGVGPIGRSLWMNNSVIQIFSLPVAYSNFCKRLSAIKASYAFYIDRILFDMRESNEIWEYVTGTSIPNLDINGLLSERRIVIPSDKVLDRFFQLMTPMYEKLYSQESRTLAAIRDALLPKLLSGEIKMKDAEKYAEALL